MQFKTTVNWLSVGTCNVLHRAEVYHVTHTEDGALLLIILGMFRGALKKYR